MLKDEQKKKLIEGLEKGVSTLQMAKHFKIHSRWLHRYVKKDLDCQMAINRYKTVIQNWFES